MRNNLNNLVGAVQLGQRLLEECRPEPLDQEPVPRSSPGASRGSSELLVNDGLEPGQAFCAKHVGVGGRRL